MRYSGQYRYEGERAAQLAAVEDYREYVPEGAEPRSFDTTTLSIKGCLAASPVDSHIH